METTAVTTRPRLHFAPAQNWMNDPNGLVFHKGLYHLYFQYNPEGIEHANMSWGHATSPDLVTWTEHDVAIRHDEDGAIFSGSVVVDEGNTSGLGTPSSPALVALYTLAQPGRQAQALACSLDDGYTWTKYPGNPVLDRQSADFRDPKVIRYQNGNESYWVMVAVEAQDRQVVFYRSDNLIDWSYLSSYGPAGAVGGEWECPDLFPLPLDGDRDAQRWVLVISLNPGALAGGSGTQYVVGHFDGIQFQPETPFPEVIRNADGSFPAQSRDELEEFMWLDHGPDCYAGVTFSGLPDDDRILIAWMSNWTYADAVPTSPWRGSMTLARRLELVTVDGRTRLRQTPILNPESLLADSAATGLPVQRPVQGAGAVDLKARLSTGAQLVITLTSEDEAGGGVHIVLDEATGRVECRRRAPSGLLMPGDYEQPQQIDAHPQDGIWSLRVYYDTGSVELFDGGGLGVMTALLCDDATTRQLEIDASGEGVLALDLRVTEFA